ncbi:MAG: hypothetical protein WC269_00735 [Candidatus Gracilibacteria bacterium]|jgi:hypothetical protein
MADNNQNTGSTGLPAGSDIPKKPENSAGASGSGQKGQFKKNRFDHAKKVEREKVKPLNPFLVDTNGKEPRKPKQAEQQRQPKQPHQPKQPQQSEQPKLKPAGQSKPTEQPKPIVQPKSAEKQEPVKQHKPAERPIEGPKPKPAELQKPKPSQPPKQPQPLQPINPFLVAKPKPEEKTPVPQKEDLEPADEGDQNLDNELPVNPFITESKPAIEPKPAEPKPAEPKPVSSFNPFEVQKPTETQRSMESPKPTESKPKPAEPEPKPAEALTAEVVETSAPKNMVGSVKKQGSVQAGGEKIEEAPAEKTVKEEILGMLGQAGITKKKITYFCSIIIVVIIVIFGANYLWKMFKPEPKIPRDTISSQENLVGTSDGLVTSYMLGIEFSEISNLLKYANYTGLLFSMDLGDISYVGGQFTDYMETLRQMQNIYDTDVYDLINRVPDRRQVLEDHLLQMKNLISKGEGFYYEVSDKMATLTSQYDLLAEQQLQYESEFFAAQKNLQSEESSSYINSFIEVSQNMAEIKARHGAYKAFRAMFANSVNALKPRYEDIFVNKEAVIQGLYVFDVPGSDIGAIIRLTEGQTAQ